MSRYRNRPFCLTLVSARVQTGEGTCDLPVGVTRLLEHRVLQGQEHSVRLCPDFRSWSQGGLGEDVADGCAMSLRCIRASGKRGLNGFLGVRTLVV